MRLFDLHCDTLTVCMEQNQALYENSRHLSLLRGQGYDAWAQVFAIWIPDGLRGAAAYAYFERSANFFEEQAAQNRTLLSPCRTAGQIGDALHARRCAAILAVEDGCVLDGELARLEQLYARGVRLMTLTWNGTNELGDGCMVEQAGGLSPFGRRAVLEMERLGILVDVSHLSRPGFYEVAQCTRRPFIATHSNSAAIWPHPRNLTDDQLRLLFRRGGLAGINLYHAFLGPAGDDGMEAVYRHVSHMLALGGERCVALGTDFDGAAIVPELAGVEKLAALYGFLLKRGLSEAVLSHLFFENAAAFFQKADI